MNQDQKHQAKHAQLKLAPGEALRQREQAVSLRVQRIESALMAGYLHLEEIESPELEERYRQELLYAEGKAAQALARAAQVLEEWALAAEHQAEQVWFEVADQELGF